MQLIYIFICITCFFLFPIAIVQRVTVIENFISTLYELGGQASEIDHIYRDNSSAELTALFAGTFIVGQDIPPGRYTITGDRPGSIFIDLGVSSFEAGISSSVPSFTFDLRDGFEIRISGINNATFTPTITELSTTLSSGLWIVGVDILPGIYNAVPNDGGHGHFSISSTR